MQHGNLSLMTLFDFFLMHLGWGGQIFAIRVQR